MLSPTESIGAISSQLGEAFSTVMNEIANPTKIPLAKLHSAVDSDPVAFVCCHLKQARAMQLLEGDYTHPNKNIDKFIKANLDTMKGSVSELVGRLSSAMPYGFSLSEPVYKSYPLSWKLDRFHYLNPTKVTFKVDKGYCNAVEYEDGGIDKNIPMKKLIHITNGLFSNFGYKYLYGSPEAYRAYPFIRLKQLIFGEMGVAGKRLATGLLVGLADSNHNIIVTDSQGNPLKDSKGNIIKRNAVDELGKQLAGLENNSYIVTDKNNTITAMQVPAGEQFWNLCSIMMDTQIMRAFVMPDTILQQGVATFGVGSLAAMQINILDSSVQEVVKQIKEQLIEKVIKNLIIWNFGVQHTYGKFSTSQSVDPNKETVTMQSLMSAMGMGIIPSTDTEAINKIRDTLGLTSISNEEAKLTEQLNSQLAQLQQQVQEAQTQQPQPQE